MEINFFKSSLDIEFEEISMRYDEFLQEYLTSNNFVNLNKWKKLASRIELSEGEQLIFDLLLDLKQEFFLLKNAMNQTKLYVNLNNQEEIEGVNFSHLKFKNECLISDQEYYGRMELNGQKICFFFKALNQNEAKISQMKNEDENIYNNFVADMQRAMIKILKEKSE